MERTLDPLADVGLAFNTARPKSAASWGAIFAGALVAIAVSLILLALGSGLGFASISPWSDQGVGATTFTVTAAIWLIVTQWVSAIFGGYIVGRLRTRWIGTHTHEIFFRDTAHGLVAWSLATVVVVAIVAASISAGIGGGVRAASSVVAAGAQGASQGAAMAQGAAMTAPNSSFGYGIDKLFRPAGAGAAGMGGDARDARGEATRIIVNAMSSGTLPDADRTYLVGLVAARTGMSEADAQGRVDEVVAAANEAEAKVKATVDAARKGAAEVSIFTALSMLVGAFIASVSAALGGRLRDEHP
jgi:hypothetical protein